MMREMIIEDDFGDEIELRFHADGTMEISILTGDAERQKEPVYHSKNGRLLRMKGDYVGGAVLDMEAVQKLHEQLSKFILLNGVSA